MHGGSKPLVYLAGPISGLNYEGATEWRDYAKQWLANSGIVGLSPMRAKEFLKHVDAFSPVNAENAAYENPLAKARGIMTRDRNDATRCDVLLVNLLGAKTVSIGTVMEVAWADANRIPIVIAMEPDNVHQHCMINEAAGYVVTSLDEAIHIVKAVIGAHH